VIPPRLPSVAMAAACVLASAVGCATQPRPGDPLPRRGDEIVIAGQLFHTGAPVILWLDPGGYDAYRIEIRSKPNATTRHSFNDREGDNQLAQLRGRIDQIVYHYDAVGSSKGCFEVLHDQRGLSAHFLLDTDGMIYQTLDVKERAWHATTSNTRSVGIEIANEGATGNPSSGPVRGEVQDQTLYQTEFTPQQYDSLIKLTAALCTALPRITCDYPRDDHGQLIPRKLPDDVLRDYHGLLGHYHVQTNKVDPGPAFEWDRVVHGARKLMRGG
jgi:N-acetyl-anhydromuramyl-L-alanine amidase AmpD